MSTDSARFLSALLPLTLAPVTIAARGYVLAKLWLWFVATQFALPLLTIPQALGLALLIGTATHQRVPTDRKSGLALVAYSLVFSGFTLGVGAIVAAFL